MKAILPSLVLLLSACASQPTEYKPRPDRTSAEEEIVPTDPTRSVAPMRGGGMTTLFDGRMAAADVDGDRIVVFDPSVRQVTQTIALPPSSEPFRLEAVGHTVIASLRGTSQVAAFDASTGESLWSTEACTEPRGVEYDGQGELFVACHSGHVVVLDADTGAILQKRQLGLYRNDLRDIVYDGQDLFVTRFRTAKVLLLDPETLEVVDVFSAGELNNLNTDLGPDMRRLTPKVAWRAIERPGGGVIVLHQRHEREPVIIQPPGQNQGESAYGGREEPQRTECAGILHTTWTEYDRSGVLTLGPVVKPPAMATDIALSEGETLLLLSSAPAPHAQGTGIARTMERSPDVDVDCHRGSLHQTETDGQVVSVAWAGSSRVAQTRLPFAILIDEEPLEIPESDAAPLDSRQLEGWATFHESTPSGLSCASCHPEGLDDGHVWVFDVDEQILPRRTPGFGGVIASTAPYHWNGEFQNLEDLLRDVLLGRMGKAPDGLIDASSLALWLDAIEPPKRDLSVLDPDAMARGKALFEDTVVGCANCHVGNELTNNATVDVGTGGNFQVPTLIGVSGRGPWMHDGCAATLEARFDPACGGDDHGNVSGLGEQDIADLVVYLRTL